MTLSLGQAAKLAGVGKTTIQRAITAGRLSATRKDDGGYSIDPAELSRVYDVRPERLQKGDGRVERDATQRDQVSDQVAAGDPELASKFAVVEAQLAGMRQLVEAERSRADAAEKDRDRWAAQAERLALLTPPPVAPKAAGLIGRLFGKTAA